MPDNKVISTSDWNEFSQKVAEAQATGEKVTIITGPETGGDFTAVVGDPANIPSFPATADYVEGQTALFGEAEDGEDDDEG